MIPRELIKNPASNRERATEVMPPAVMAKLGPSLILSFERYLTLSTVSLCVGYVM